MELKLNRAILTAAFTLGCITLSGHQYFTVEDTVRPLSACTVSSCVGKINGRTAIPAGRYRIKDTYSPRFKKYMLELQNVPGFQGIRIHSGNTADDTEGCLVLGLKRTATGVAQSNAAMAQFNSEVRAALHRGEEVWITIE